jgi:hypothetical protein
MFSLSDSIRSLGLGCKRIGKTNSLEDRKPEKDEICLYLVLEKLEGWSMLVPVGDTLGSNTR